VNVLAHRHDHEYRPSWKGGRNKNRRFTTGAGKAAGKKRAFWNLSEIGPHLMASIHHETPAVRQVHASPGTTSPTGAKSNLLDWHAALVQGSVSFANAQQSCGLRAKATMARKPVLDHDISGASLESAAKPLNKGLNGFLVF